MAYCRYN